MSDKLIESIGREAILRVLLQPAMGMETKYTNTMDGTTVETSVPVQGPSIAQHLAADLLHDQKVRKELFEYLMEKIREKPELVTEPMAEQLTKWFSQLDSRGSLYARGEFLAEVNKEFRNAVRVCAAKMLEDNEAFRERVLDMASLSDSDRIEINISLKPAGQ